MLQTTFGVRDRHRLKECSRMLQDQHEYTKYERAPKRFRNDRQKMDQVPPNVDQVKAQVRETMRDAFDAEDANSTSGTKYETQHKNDCFSSAKTDGALRQGNLVIRLCKQSETFECLAKERIKIMAHF